MDIETCPICGVSVIPAFLEGTGIDFAPPYSTNTGKDCGIPRSLYEANDSKTQLNSQDNEKDLDEEEPALDDFKRVVMAVALLLSGSVFFLFGVALGLFSHDGVLTLSWDGSFWYAYALLAIPLLLFGWRSLMKLD